MRIDKDKQGQTKIKRINKDKQGQTVINKVKQG